MMVWVVLPAYNEAESLPPVIEGLEATLTAAGLPFHIVVVNDGSRDETGAVAVRYAARLPVAVVTHRTNQGLGRAVDSGFRAILTAAGPDDIVVTMDADNTHPPGTIPAMVRAVASGADLVIASRYAPGGAEEGVPPLRRVLSLGIGWLMRARFGLRGVRDYSSGYRAYRARLLKAAVARYGDRLIETDGFAVMAELLVKLQSLRPAVVEVPLHLRYDQKAGPSKMRVGRTIRDYLRLLLAPRRALFPN